MSPTDRTDPPAATIAAFAAALLDPDRPTPPDLCAWNGSDPQVRLDVHRNTVIHSLVEALADTVPVVRQLVGEAFFRTLALHYTRRHPPRSPALWRHADGLPDFIEAYEPAAGLPWLADVARLEIARLASYHAADAVRCRAEDLARAALRPDQLPGLRLQLHPSARVLCSAFPVVSLWQAHQGDGDPSAIDLSAIDLSQPEAAMLVCDDDEPWVVPIPPPTARWLQALAGGAPLATAVQAAITPTDGDAVAFDLSAAWALVLARGALSGWTLETP